MPAVRSCLEVIKFRMEQSGLSVKDLEPLIGKSNRVHPAALEADDPDLLLLALGDVGRALGVKFTVQPA